MKRPLLLLVLISVLMALMSPAAAGSSDPPSTSPLKGEWHRLAPGPSGTADDAAHEVERFYRANDAWVSIYMHDPTWPGTTTPVSLGEYRGVEVDVADLDLWLPGMRPHLDDITFAVNGKMTFDKTGDTPIVLPSMFVTTESGMAWWISVYDFPGYFGLLSCPWYRTFDDALAAHPANPYIGDGYNNLGCNGVEDFPRNGVVDRVWTLTEQNCTDGYDNDGDGPVDEADPDCAS